MRMAAVSLKHIKKVYPNTEKKKKKKGEEAPARRLKVTEEGVLAVDDFNLEATIGLSIAPSEVAFARTRVSVESEMMCVRLTREKYLAVMRFARAFGKWWRRARWTSRR